MNKVVMLNREGEEYKEDGTREMKQAARSGRTERALQRRWISTTAGRSVTLNSIGYL
jgi:hypothetical protein